MYAGITIRHLVADTFRQSIASRLFMATTAAIFVCVALCASARIEGKGATTPKGETELFGGDGKPLSGPNPKPGHVSLGFGAITLPLFRDAEEEVLFLESALAKWGAGSIGVLLAIVWTGGFLPDFLRPSSVSILLAKPLSRTTLLIGKCVGILIFVSVEAIAFVGGTWIALGLRTGIWNSAYLWAAPLFVLEFGVVFAISALLAVWTRNASAAIFGSIAFWVICTLVNYGRFVMHEVYAVAPKEASIPTGFVGFVEAIYWLLPKPADLAIWLEQTIGAAREFAIPSSYENMIDIGGYHPILSAFSSSLFAIVVFVVATRRFAEIDY